MITNSRRVNDSPGRASLAFLIAMRFRITTIAYVFALLAAGMAVFGGSGLFVAIAVLGFWGCLFDEHGKGPPLPEYLTWVASALLIAFVLWPDEAADDAVATGRRSEVVTEFGWDRLYALAVFVALSLTPGRIWLKRRRGEIEGTPANADSPWADDSD